MFNPHITFEMSTITGNEEMKSNAKCKNFRFEPPFGGLIGVTYTVHLWLAGKHVVDFLLAIIVFVSSHGSGTIKRNLSKSAFSDGGGSL